MTSVSEASRRIGLHPQLSQMLSKNALHLDDGVRVSLQGVWGANIELGLDTLEPGILDTDDTVILPFRRSRLGRADDRMTLDAGGQRFLPKLDEEGVTGPHVVDGGRHLLESTLGLSILIVVDELDSHFRDIEWQGHETGSDIAQTKGGEVATTVGRCHEDHPLHERKGLEDGGSLEPRKRLLGKPLFFDRLVRDVLPERGPRIDRLEFRQETPLAVPDDHHVIQSRVFAVRIELRHGGRQALT
jgi:hypothetical protein